MSGGPGKQPPVSVDALITKTQLLIADIEVPGSLLANESAEVRPDVSGRRGGLAVRGGRCVWGGGGKTQKGRWKGRT